MNEPEVITIEEAKKRRLIKFYTGIPCKKCGELSYTYVKNLSCQACNRLKMNKRYRRTHENSVRKPEKRPTIPGARLIKGRCQSGSPDSSNYE